MTSTPFVRSHDTEIHYEAQGHSPFFEEPEAFDAMLARFF